MADDDYMMMSQKELKELKDEIGKLKKNPLGENKSSDDLLGAIGSLTDSMRDLMDMFKEAGKEMHSEEGGGKQFEKLHEKLDVLIEQNKKIAKGIVTVADLMSKPEERPPEPKPQSAPPPADPFGMPPSGDPFGAPSGPPGMPPLPPQGAPFGPPGMPPSPGPMPPPPGPMPPPPGPLPEPEKKGGLFHMGK